MELDAPIYVAGHRGLVGSALVRRLHAAGYHNLILRTRAELDLADARAVAGLFQSERPHYVFLAAARVGGILANRDRPAEFIRENLCIETNVIEQAHRSGVQRLLFLGSSCVYPRCAPQPISEEQLLAGPLELTNRSYALAKIAGIELCWAYNRQYGTQFITAMPSNLYGPNDHYDAHSSHVVPALIRKFEAAKNSSDRKVVIWGSGTPRREFLYSDDAADACIHLMNLGENEWAAILGPSARPPLVNVGWGQDISIRELAEIIAETVGVKKDLVFDPSKPDGTPRKLLDVTLMASLGWKPSTRLRSGLAATYQDYCARSACGARQPVATEPR